MNELMQGTDGRLRCPWPGDRDAYCRYHDEEWGWPQGDDQRLFEKLCLEGFQAGLSWWTILQKRENFRKAFRNFDPERVARFTPRTVDRLLTDQGIVRHRKKIEAAINNARCTRRLQERHGSLAGFLWSYAPDPPAAKSSAVGPAGLQEVPAQTDASRALAKALRAEGFQFLGPTTIYAFMQSVGMVNDHLEGCFCRPLVAEARARFAPPS